MRSRKGPIAPARHRFTRRDWAEYFDAIATGDLVLKPHTARRRAGEAARACPYEDIAATGLAKVKAAIKARATHASEPGPKGFE
jgi:hypothetical protein